MGHRAEGCHHPTPPPTPGHKRQVQALREQQGTGRLGAGSDRSGSKEELLGPPAPLAHVAPGKKSCHF